MAVLPENHYCHFPGCGVYLGPDDGDADCGEHNEECDDCGELVENCECTPDANPEQPR